MEKKEWTIYDHVTGISGTYDTYDVRAALRKMFDTTYPETAEYVNAVAEHVERGVPLDPGVTEYLQIAIERS